ncbi:hypothetical protein pb186bvf_014404, partial [Paramecium bursaria]
MRNRCNSQQTQSVSQMKDVVHHLQLKDASYRLDISNLKKQIKDWQSKYTNALKQINDLKKIQIRDNEYILRIDNFVTQLKEKIKKQSQIIDELKQNKSSFNKVCKLSINSMDTCVSENINGSQFKNDSQIFQEFEQKTIKTETTQKPQFKIKMPLSEKPSSLYEQFLNR